MLLTEFTIGSGDTEETTKELIVTGDEDVNGLSSMSMFYNYDKLTLIYP